MFTSEVPAAPNATTLTVQANAMFPPTATGVVGVKSTPAVNTAAVNGATGATDGTHDIVAAST